jgi:lambda family phage holin
LSNLGGFFIARDLTMPTKDPNFWTAVIDFLGGIWNAVDWNGAKVGVYAAIAAFLRIFYDQKETKWQRIILEVLLSGLIAKGAEQIALSFGYEHLDVAIGAIIGMIGVLKIRSFAMAFLKSRTEKNPA